MKQTDANRATSRAAEDLADVFLRHDVGREHVLTLMTSLTIALAIMDMRAPLRPSPLQIREGGNA